MKSIVIPHREPSGRPKRKALTQKERETMQVALAQPHRIHARSPDHEWRCELFGRLILDNGWGFDERGQRLRFGPQELYDAGNRFKREYHAWQKAKASRRAWANEGARPTKGAPDDLRAAQAAEEAIARYVGSLRVFEGLPARCYEAAVSVILADHPEEWVAGYGEVESAYDALWALAEYYGR